MATATRKNSVPPSSPTPDNQAASKPEAPFLVRAFDATFRFLASVKLAVFCLLTLSTALAIGTRINTWYGMASANELVYRTRWFSLLLAFLAMNILCAALIRFPWVKRQTGFLITHAGLLTVIAGSWYGAHHSDEGQLGMIEGQTSSELVRSDKPAMYVRSIDPHTGQAKETTQLPFSPGTFDWAPGRYEVVSKPKDPFKLAIKKFFINSRYRRVVEADPAGSPMVKIRPMVKPPKAETFIDALGEDEQWFSLTTQRIPRIVKRIPRAQVGFFYNEDHEVFDDFVNPPEEAGRKGVARLHYVDQSGKDRSFDIKIDDAVPNAPITLPDSDLTVTYVGTRARNQGRDPDFVSSTGESILRTVDFNVKKGTGAEITHTGYANLPMIPAVFDPEKNPSELPKPLLAINYYLPPVVDPDANGRFDVIEVMADDHGRLAYRVYVRGNGEAPGKLGPHGLLKAGQEVNATPNSDPAAMNMKFVVEEFLDKAVEKDTFVSFEAPQEQKDQQISAVLAEFTVDGVTKEVWLRRSPGLDQIFEPVTFPSGMYELSFDSDRLDLGFSLTLDDFDAGFDPGTNNPASFQSEVRVTDEAEKIKDKPFSIYMNHPLDHRGWRFFQSSYNRPIDKKTGRPTGEFMSVFQVAKNPARIPIYSGCIIVVLGAFVQFYMRAGIFTDGGKLEQKRAADKARKRLEAKLGKAPSAEAADDQETL